MKRLRFLLPCLALLVGLSAAATNNRTNEESVLVIMAEYKEGLFSCPACQVDNDCTLTSPGIRCLCLGNGAPAYKTGSGCTIAIYKPNGF